MTAVSDSQYLSIGEVLGLLLEDFPDVTISKIRFLESQGLIEPERTPSGYRKFYDHDVDLLRAILHEQRENFLPLKVIRDRIESGGIQGDSTGARTPPRGIRNVDTRPAPTTLLSASAAPTGEPRDSVFRRTDGGPEWADGRALIPGDSHLGSTSPITAAVPVVPHTPAATAPVERLTHSHVEIDTVTVEVEPLRASHPTATEKGSVDIVAALIESPVPAPDPAPAVAPTPATAGSANNATSSSRSRVIAAASQDLPFDRSELCAAAGINAEQLAELESYGLIQGRGTGADTTYPADCIEIARVASRFLDNGIDARHLRTWRQAAEREAALFEQRIMPLLRQRNPQSRQTALDTLTELADLGGQLRSALVHAVLRHHFDGS